MNNHLKGNLDLKSIDLKEHMENFIDYLDVNEKTLIAYRYGITGFLTYLESNGIKLPQRNDVVEFRNNLRDNYSSATVNMYMASVRALFKYLHINKLYENITENIKGSKYSEIPKKEILSLDQVKYIYENLEDLEEKSLWSLLFTTGLRGCEVTTANIEDIKQYNGENVLFVLGKKRDDKSEYVKLSDQVLNDIKNYIGNRNQGSIFISKSNNNKGNGITTKTIRVKIKTIYKRFGLEGNSYSVHSSRRSMATISYQLGQNIYDIKSVLRHKSINTTTRYINACVRNENKTESIVSNAMLG